MNQIYPSSHAKKLILGLIVALILLIPSMVWISLHKQPFPGDHSAYAIDSMRLFSAMSESLPDWLQEMRSVGYLRGPSISWIGQFFVGIGLTIGSIDTGLLFSGILIELLAIWVLYIAVLELSGDRVSVALLGALMLGAAPKFIGSPHLFNIEPHQTLAVAWFVLILAFTPKWSQALVLGQLILAGAFSLVAKSSTSVYVVIPAAAILYSAFLSPRKSRPGGWAERGAIISWVLGVMLLAAGIIWYFQNWDSVLSHAFRSGFGPSAEIWGLDAPYLNTLLFWLDELQKFYFQPIALFIFMLLVFAGLRAYRKRRSLRDTIDHFALITFVSALQVAIILLLFAFSPNRHTRFITPLLPYIAVITCWSVVEIGQRWIQGILFLAFGFQMLAANAYSLGLISSGSSLARFTDVIFSGPFSSDPANQDILNEIVERTCDADNPGHQLTIVAVDPALRGDWLAPVPATYTAYKMFGSDISCEFGYAGNGFWGAELDETWLDLIARDVSYIATTDPDIYPPPPDTMNQSLSLENHPRLVERIVKSGKFVELPSLNSDPGILLFMRVDYVADGRILLELGEIEAGIETLEKATKLEPENPEAWANLTFGYMLAGRQDDALQAGSRALELNPDHFYVHLMMAQVFQQLGAHRSALSHLSQALRIAPSEHEEARALLARAESLLATGEAPQACLALADAVALEPLAELPAALSNLDCVNVGGGD